MVEYKASESIDGVFAALADPTRRAIVELLMKNERRVTELAEPFDMSLNAVSKHIKKLEAAGLVIRRKEGRQYFLRANPARLAPAADWFEAQRRFWNPRLDRLEALMREETENE